MLQQQTAVLQRNQEMQASANASIMTLQQSQERQAQVNAQIMTSLAFIAEAQSNQLRDTDARKASDDETQEVELGCHES